MEWILGLLLFGSAVVVNSAMNRLRNIERHMEAIHQHLLDKFPVDQHEDL